MRKWLSCMQLLNTLPLITKAYYHNNICFSSEVHMSEVHDHPYKHAVAHASERILTIVDALLKICDTANYLLWYNML
jgi:hypothetical protein